MMMLKFLPFLLAFCFTDAVRANHRDLLPLSDKQGHHDNLMTKTIPSGDDILSIAQKNPWTEESLLQKRTKFHKEEIDDLMVRDYNVELLLEGMTVGNSGIDYKPYGLNTFKKPLQMALEAEMNYMKMILNRPQPGQSRTKRTLRSKYEKIYIYWPNATVPYYINETAFKNPEKLVGVVDIAVQQLENQTCLHFVRLTSQEMQALLNQGNNDFVVITNEGTGGCSTYIGRLADNSIQKMFLDESVWFCILPSTVVHEFGHTLGMFHEHMRADRDEHLKINVDNLDPRIVRNNFDKFNTKDRTPLDFTSIMMYGPYAAGEKSWIPVIEALDLDLQFLIGGDYLSYYDVWNINKAYQCAADCRDLPCANGGFRDFTCNCKCPPGIIGPTCNQIVNSDMCGGIVKVDPYSETMVVLQDVSSLSAIGTTCYWLLQAPDGYAITVEMLEFNLAWNDTRKICYHWLEISYNVIGQPGPKYCGDSFSRGKITTSKFGEPNVMMLKLDLELLKGLRMPGGFKLKAKAYKVYQTRSEGCPRPPKVDHTTNNYKEVGSKNGAVVSYKCIYPYTMFGDIPSITCQGDGTWSNVGRFSCRLKEPLFSCNFETDECSIDISRVVTDGYSWKRFVVDGNAFMRVERSINVERTYTAALFVLPLQLESFTEYCISMSIYRPFGSGSCAAYYINSAFKNANSRLQYIQTHMNSFSCLDTEWAIIRGTLSNIYPFYIYLNSVASPNAPFNLDVDNIVVRKGRC